MIQAMGAFGSGRKRWVNVGTVESVPRLDIRPLVRTGVIRDGALTEKVIGWKGGNTGLFLNMVKVSTDLRDRGRPHLALAYFSVQGFTQQCIELDAVPWRFGGTRYFFRCPVTSTRREVLTLGEHGFACARANRHTYLSQSEGSLDRAARAQRKIKRRLWPHDRRKRARGKRFSRLFERWAELDDKLWGGFPELLEQIDRNGS